MSGILNSINGLSLHCHHKEEWYHEVKSHKPTYNRNLLLAVTSPGSLVSCVNLFLSYLPSGMSVLLMFLFRSSQIKVEEAVDEEKSVSSIH